MAQNLYANPLATMRFNLKLPWSMPTRVWRSVRSKTHEETKESVFEMLDADSPNSSNAPLLRRPASVTFFGLIFGWWSCWAERAIVAWWSGTTGSRRPDQKARFDSRAG